MKATLVREFVTTNRSVKVLAWTNGVLRTCYNSGGNFDNSPGYTFIGRNVKVRGKLNQDPQGRVYFVPNPGDRNARLV